MMRIVRSAWQTLAVGMLLYLTSGCETGSEPLALVRGKVSYKGIPLSTGTIVFTPDALRGTTGPLARADIQPDGTYSLRSQGLPGATVGWHRVTVMAVESGPGIGPNEEFIAPCSLIPEKYRDPELSGLSCQIRSGQENYVDFDLD